MVWSNSLYQQENTDHKPLSRWLDSVISPIHCLKVWLVITWRRPCCSAVHVVLEKRHVPVFLRKSSEDANLTEEELALNIFELDAASNNSVDDIRRLIDQVRFAPQTGKFKVYIIDEVHMLSQQAFNAFLKTLEEPPAHAIFILATTEKHKIIPTILSRCQIFDFKRITVDDIAGHLAFVAEKEGVQAEPEALHHDCRKGRRGPSRCLEFVRPHGQLLRKRTYLQSSSRSTRYLRLQLLLPLDRPRSRSQLLLIYFSYTTKYWKRIQWPRVCRRNSQAFQRSLVAREPRTVELLEVGPAIKQRYLEQSAATSTRFLLHGLKVFNELDGQYKASSQAENFGRIGSA